MALTLEVEQRLENVQLIEFFETERSHWLALAQEAYNFVRRNFPDGATVRHDDVAQALMPVLAVHRLLTNHLAEERLGQQYWVKYFCDSVLDRCWGEINQ
jgi:hypothetical protein